MIRFSIVMITTAMAEEWLAGAHHNRNVSPITVKHLATAIKGGVFHLTHQGIALDPDDRLIDGEHRLRAIVVTGVPVLMCVARYSSREAANAAREVFDSGRKRDLGDQLAILGVLPDKGRQRIAAARVIRFLETGMNGSPAEARQLAIEYMSDHTAIVAIADSAWRTPVVAPLVWVRAVNPERIDHLVAVLSSGVGMSETEAMLYSLIHKPLSHATETRIDFSLKVLRLVEAYLNGEKLGKVQAQTRANIIDRLRDRK